MKNLILIILLLYFGALQAQPIPVLPAKRDIKVQAPATTQKKTTVNKFIEDCGSCDQDLIKGYGSRTGKYGLKNANGKMVVDLIYDEIGDFEDGIARVRLKEKQGFIDINGKIVIPFKYDYDTRSSFYNGLLNVTLNEKFGFIDVNGKIVIPIKYDFLDWHAYDIIVAFINGKYGFIDKTGNTVIDFIYDDAKSFYAINGTPYTIVTRNGKDGCINKHGKEVIKTEYESLYISAEDPTEDNFVIIFSKDKKYGLLDTAGNIIVQNIYDQIPSFWNGTLNVTKNGLEGVIDTTGNEIIPCIYDYIGDRREKKIHVKYKGEYFYIDKNGKRL